MSDEGGGGGSSKGFSGGGKGAGDSGPSGGGFSNGFGGGEAPGLPGVSAGGGASTSPTAVGGGGMFDNLPGLGGVDFSYLNAPGVQTSAPGFGAAPGASAPGGEVPGYGFTDFGFGSGTGGGEVPGLPGVSASLTQAPGTNVVPGAAVGPGAAPGLPGVGGAPTDLSSVGRPSGTAAGQPEKESILTSLGIKNPIGTAIGAGGLAYAMSQGQQPAKFSPEMEAAARRLDSNGQQLMSYLQSGNLPPGLKAGLDQATAAAKARIVSNFAAQGLNTDPTQNSVLAQQLAQVEQMALISTAQIGQQLLQSGITESGLASDLYKTLASIDQTQTANIGKAIANFASSLNAGGGGINLKVA